jgi:hypothetical protein
MTSGVMEWHLAECRDSEACWALEKVFKFFEWLEKPSSLNEGGSTSGSTRGLRDQFGEREFIDWLYQHRSVHGKVGLLGSDMQ